MRNQTWQKKRSRVQLLPDYLMAWPEWHWPPQILRQIYAIAECNEKVAVISKMQRQSSVFIARQQALASMQSAILFYHFCPSVRSFVSLSAYITPVLCLKAWTCRQSFRPS